MNKVVLAIDPGPEKSGYIFYNARSKTVLEFGHETNNLIIFSKLDYPFYSLVIERPKCYGKVATEELLETCIEIGRIKQRFFSRKSGLDKDFDYREIPRKTVATIMCLSATAGKPQIRQAIIDLYGGKKKAIGLKKEKGPLYGLTNHVWDALALALTYVELLKFEEKLIYGKETNYDF